MKKDEYEGQYDIVEKISFADGQIHIREFPETGMDLYIADRGDIITSKINIHQGAVAFAPRRLACSTHYQVYRTSSPDCRSDYLVQVLRSSQFIEQLLEQKNKGIKNEQGSEFIRAFEIPLPPPETQEALAKRMCETLNIIHACRCLHKNFSLHIPELFSHDTALIGEAVIETKNGWSPQCNGGSTPVLAISCLQHGCIDYSERKYTNETRKDVARFYIREGDFFYSRGNGNPDLVALAAIAGRPPENIVFPDLLTRVSFDKQKILPEYAVLLFNSTLGREYFSGVHKGSVSMVKISQKYMSDFPVPYLGDLAKQELLVKDARESMDALMAIGRLEQDAKQRIAQTMRDIWG